MGFHLQFIILAVAVLIPMFAIRFYPSRPPRIASTDDQKLINPVQDSEIFDEVFLYPDVFLHNYALMEEHFKIFVYPKKDEEIFYYNERNIHGMFSSELFFHYSLLVADRFATCDESEANMFFIPLTWFQILGKGVYANGENYVWYLINEYPYWNRTKGLDHFFVTCHDTGARLSERVPLNDSIAALCSASYDSGHDIHRKHHHITLPQIRLPYVSPEKMSALYLINEYPYCTVHPYR
ncbi:probable glycosyltransferase At5g03795 [Tripterygium wilfordii]|uniref:probable glycosyltransferase At5g03795 n=1 Tax=Tripterygium wilfordii TaxID=458696 RepID=UPI0018F7E751|nr:probable glycosyltransferase At5g03795 [Tripterygium wilfordii]